AKAVPATGEPGRRFTGFDLANIDILHRHLMTILTLKTGLQFDVSGLTATGCAMHVFSRWQGRPRPEIGLPQYAWRP
ncbi:hypothetical protein, partial [Mycobacterium montefiorense]|uniref:hypothetical protein n=1 Tax=Mycobacterium montefiorense TaxID=154654 RepID=UPI0021C26276